jgi:hypothetical protein
MSVSVRVIATLKGINGLLEVLLGFPFLGGLYIITHAWQPLVFMFFLHMVTLLLTIVTKSPYKTGSLLGMLTSILGFIPFIGMLLHLSTALVNLSESYQLYKGKKIRW